jgi:hypothetical protein
MFVANQLISLWVTGVTEKKEMSSFSFAFACVLYQSFPLVLSFNCYSACFTWGFAVLGFMWSNEVMVQLVALKKNLPS